MKNIVHVPLENRAYDVVIGADIISSLPDYITELCPKQTSFVIISEDNVVHHHYRTLEKILLDAGLTVHLLSLPAGENTKNFAYLEQVVRFCLEKKVERHHVIIAFGGGVIGDLTGFATSMIRRGCKFIQIPTTLLAQVDSSVGGKTAINTPEGKNLVGSFYQPALVLADTDYLQTLSNRDYKAGYAEVLKYGLLGDADFFDYLEQSQNACDVRDKDFLLKIVTHSVQMKADIVVRDEHEKADRALLNLGHTFGHAYEAMCGYSDKLLHGEAVALGMVHAFAFSAEYDFCDKTEGIRVKQVIANAGLPTDLDMILPHSKASHILDYMLQDKKMVDGGMNLILAHGIGRAFIEKNVQQKQILDFLNTIKT